MPGIMAAGMVLGGLPLLASMLLFLKLMAARDAGHPLSGDAIGLAMMSALAYRLALLSLAVGAGYFTYKRIRQNTRPNAWHWTALSWMAFEVTAPALYLSFF